MSSTSAEEVSIHAVSPLSIFEAGAGAGAAAAGAGAGCCAMTTATVADRTSRIARTRLSRFTRLSFRSVALEGRLIALARPDPDGGLHGRHEDLAVADVARLGGGRDDLGHLVDELVGDDDLHLDLREEIDRVLTAAIELGVALLAPETAHLGHRHADDADTGQGFLDVVELERLDDGFDLLHGLTPRRGWGTSAPTRES